MSRPTKLETLQRRVKVLEDQNRIMKHQLQSYCRMWSELSNVLDAHRTPSVKAHELINRVDKEFG